MNQRFAYQEGKSTNPDGQRAKKCVRKGKPQQKQKMTVRLRPRKVLCSNCKGICNENNENVDLSRKRKQDPEDDSDGKRRHHTENKYLMKSTLIPKLSRLQPQEISNAIKGSSRSRSANKLESNKASENLINIEKSDVNRVTQELAFVDVGENADKTLDFEGKTENIESYKDDGSFNTVFSSTRTLKISYGEGEGTVVKIPAVMGDYNEDSGVSCDMLKPMKQGDSKAVKKALKRAKKEERKKINIQSVETKLPKHVGALSPHNNMTVNLPGSDALQKKHKHKLKHKKKNKVPKMDGGDENTGNMERVSIGFFSDIKKHCLKQKLSISLRRLSSNSYERCEEQECSDSDESDSEIVPEFPATSSVSVSDKALRVSSGDVVWGKVAGHPWWPGQVLSVTSGPHAHVAWYASTMSSLMPCESLRPFLDDYKVLYNIFL